MSLGQVLIYADEENNVIPEILVEVPSQAITDAFGFADVNRRLPGFGIGATQKVDA
jgi:hypothetical protein